MTGPTCQMADCTSAAEETCEHPEFGDIQVCPTCAKLFVEA